MRLCAYSSCGKETKNKLYCSRRCAAKVNNHRKIVTRGNCSFCRKELYGKRQKYCGIVCQKMEEAEDRLDKWRKGLLTGYTGKNKQLCTFIRKYMLEKYNNTCTKCGWAERHPVDNLPLVEINHIDGDAGNCKEENLEVLCPNCHSKTPNFRARNKSSTRFRN